jgi:hypothetical protein
MREILSFERYTGRLNEGLGDYGYVPDPTMSTDALTKHTSDTQQQFARYQTILGAIFNDLSIKAGDGELQDIENLTVVRIYPNTNGSLDVYISLVYAGVKHYGVFRNWGSVSGTTFDSKALYRFRERETGVRFEGILKKSLNKWFRPQTGKYRVLKDVRVFEEIMGDISYLPAHSEVIVDEVLMEDGKPCVYFLKDDKRYYMADNDYYYFHWWFEPVRQREFYF